MASQAVSNQAHSNGAPAFTEAFHAPEHEMGRRLFVGNLSFETSDSDLHTLFASIGAVEAAQIVKRGKRSLGYAFVVYKDESSATAAVSSFDKKDLSGRTINVELAKPGTGPKPKRERKPRESGGDLTHEEAVAAVPGEAASLAREKGLGGRGRGRGRGGRGGGASTRGRGPRVDDLDESDPAAAVEAAEVPVRNGTSGRGRGRGGRVPRPRKGPDDHSGVPSPTLLFVNFLPYTYTDDDLLKLFTELPGCPAPVSAKTVKRRPYRGKNPRNPEAAQARPDGTVEERNKGFGFVNFASPADQAEALRLAEGHALEINGRKLVIKVALDERPHQTDGPAGSLGQGTASGDAVQAA